MSEYRRLRAVELQEKCERRGIDPSGLNKTGMISALHDYDELNNNGDEVRASGGNVPPNGGEVDGDNGDGEVRFRAPTLRSGAKLTSLVENHCSGVGCALPIQSLLVYVVVVPCYLNKDTRCDV